MTRVAVALAVVIALAAGVWMLWPDDERPPTTTSTLPLAASSSTSTAPPPSTTSTVDDHIVETVEEAEAILRDLWFGWFEGIYNEDEDRIREVTVTQEQVETAIAQFGNSSFERAPQPADITFGGTEILRSDLTCLVAWTATTVEGFRSGSSEGVHVVRWTDGRWKRLSLWQYRNDLWQRDCG